MACACRLFGLTFGVGVRNRPPNKGDPSVSLHHADVVNLVDIISNEYDNLEFVGDDRQSELVTAQGADFIFESYSRTLKIRVRYRKFDGQTPLVASTLNLNLARFNPNGAESQAHEGNQQWVQYIVPGTCFVWAGQVVEVVRVDGRVVVVVEEDSDNEVNLDINEAVGLLKAYIG
jgi:hypothetical protein